MLNAVWFTEGFDYPPPHPFYWRMRLPTSTPILQKDATTHLHTHFTEGYDYPPPHPFFWRMRLPTSTPILLKDATTHLHTHFTEGCDYLPPHQFFADSLFTAYIYKVSVIRLCRHQLVECMSLKAKQVQRKNKIWTSCFTQENKHTKHNLNGKETMTKQQHTLRKVL